MGRPMLHIHVPWIVRYEVFFKNNPLVKRIVHSICETLAEVPGTVSFTSVTFPLEIGAEIVIP